MRRIDSKLQAGVGMWHSSTGTPPKLVLNRGGSGAHKTCRSSETVQDRTKVTITDY